MLGLYYIVAHFVVLPPATEVAALSAQGRIIFFKFCPAVVLGMLNPTWDLGNDIESKCFDLYSTHLWKIIRAKTSYGAARPPFWPKMARSHNFGKIIVRRKRRGAQENFFWKNNLGDDDAGATILYFVMQLHLALSVIWGRSGRKSLKSEKINILAYFFAALSPTTNIYSKHVCAARAFSYPAVHDFLKSQFLAYRFAIINHAH